MSTSQINKIALVGAGATGTIIGSLIAKSGKDIVLIDTNEEHVEAINVNGAKITGGMKETISVKALTPNQMEGQFDLVIYSVKSTADDIALPQILPHLHEKSVVITTQNGVPEEKVASYIGKERTLGASIVGWAASLEKPGVANLAGTPDGMLYKIGELNGEITPRIKQVKSVLEAAGKVEYSENLAGMRWTKLIINVSMSGLSAALGCTFGEILDSEKALNTALTLKIETYLTAKKLGIEVDQVNNMDPEEFIQLMKKNEEGGREKLREFFSPQRSGKPSMLQDLEKGRKTEVESISGYLSKKSAAAGIPTPVNDSVLKIIRGIQDGTYSLTMNNLDMIRLKPFSEILGNSSIKKNKNLTLTDNDFIERG